MQIVVQISLDGEENFVPDYNEGLAMILRASYKTAKNDFEKNLRQHVRYSVGTSISYTAVEAIERLKAV